MNNDYDSRYVTKEFLLTYFPSPNRFHELINYSKTCTFDASKQRYVQFKKNLNQERQKSGKKNF